MTDLVTVRVIAPAKLADRWLRPGDEVAVSLADRDALAAVRAIVGDDADAAALATSVSDFEAAVAARAEHLARVVVEAAVETAVEDLVRERDAALARLAEAEAERDQARAERDLLTASAADTGSGAAGAAPNAARAPKGARAAKG